MCCKPDMVKKTLYTFLLISVLVVFAMAILSVKVSTIMRESADKTMIKILLPIRTHLEFSGMGVIFITAFIGWLGARKENRLYLYAYVLSMLSYMVFFSIKGINCFLHIKNDAIFDTNETIKTIAIAFICMVSVQLATIILGAIFALILACSIDNNRNNDISESTYLIIHGY